ncbi:MAG: PKD domain-containing protein, partial [Planctomycetota bacterium]
MTWRGGDPDRGDAVTYDVYLGTNPMPPLRASGLTSPSFVVTDLAPSTKYLWRVEAKDMQGLSVKGPLWSFTTADKANTLPIAHAAATPSAGSATTEFRLSAEASKDAEDSLSDLEVRWDFDGDGKEYTEWSRDKEVTKTFGKLGTHKITVEVRDSQGGVSKASVTVEVSNSEPVLEGEPIPLNGSTGEPVTVKLGWKYKDPDPGDTVKYDVFLGRAEGEIRAVARGIEESTFTPEKPLDKGTLYYWRVDARDSQGAVTRGPLWSFATAKKEVIQPFHAEIAVKPKSGRTTTPFHFDGSASSDPEESSESLKVRWDFNGDGEYETDWSEEKTAVKTFTEMGVIKVVLEVKNSKGDTATSFVEVEVANTPPTFVGKPGPLNGAAGLEGDVTLKWRVTDPDPEDQAFFKVYFANATAGALLPVAEEISDSKYRPAPWLKPGTYNWKVEAEDSHGAKTESPIWTFTVKARSNNPPLKPEGLEGPLNVRLGKKVSFVAKSRDADGDPIRIRFDWGDGSVSPWVALGENGMCKDEHLYAKIGDYAIRAQAIDDKQTSSAWSENHPLKVLPPLKKGEEPEDVWHWDPKVLADLPDLLTFKARYWFANLGGEGNWKGAGDPTADLTFASDLGIKERRGAPWIHAELGKHITGGL